MKNKITTLTSRSGFGFDRILTEYQGSFAQKTYAEENDTQDVLMDVFGLTQAIKRENRQYWGRELGMCWQKMVTQLCQEHSRDWGPAIRTEEGEPCDLTVGPFAIDTKYRIGSGDSGTLKKFRAYAGLLKELGYIPTLLILREDNLEQSLAACAAGGWTITTGDASFAFIQELTGVDMKAQLIRMAHRYPIQRPA